MKFQHMAYKPDGSARIFDLALDESLPEGWHPTPDVIEDPELRTADAISAALAGRKPEVKRSFNVVGPSDVEALRAEADVARARIAHLEGIIEAGKAENAKLLAELASYEEELNAAAAEMAEIKARHAAPTKAKGPK